MIFLIVFFVFLFVLAGISPLLVTDDTQDIVRIEHS